MERLETSWRSIQTGLGAAALGLVAAGGANFVINYDIGPKAIAAEQTAEACTSTGDTVCLEYWDDQLAHKTSQLNTARTVRQVGWTAVDAGGLLLTVGVVDAAVTMLRRRPHS